MSKDSTQQPRLDSNRGPLDPKSYAVTDWPLRLIACRALLKADHNEKRDQVARLTKCGGLLISVEFFDQQWSGLISMVDD